MHFLGLGGGDPETMTLMDFEPLQAGEMRFLYVLPYAQDRALVEYDLLGRTLARGDYELRAPLPG